MTMKTKLMATIAVLLAVSGALVLWATRDAVPGGGSSPARNAEPSSVASSDLSRDAVAAAPNAAEATHREAAVAATVPTSATGTLVVHVRYGDDKALAAGVTMIVFRSAADPRVEGLRQTTDAAGAVRFETLAAGRVNVTSDRGWLGKRAEIRGGETTELEYELEVGLTVTGIVVDAVGTPVPGALIEVAPLGHADADAEVMATSGADGRFVVRAAPTATLVGARAAGHSSSPLKFLGGKDGNTADVRLELGPPAGAVSGLVVDAQNRPVARAVVRVGHGATSGIVATGTSAPPIPALVRTDDDGRFLALGVPPGTQPVVARAPGKAPWRGECEVAANLTAPLRIELADGATISGTVCNAAGEVAAQVEVEVGNWDDLAHYRTVTAKDGRFELTGLPAGEVVLTADHDTFGKAEQRARTVAGSATTCDLKLSRGLELRGRVLDERGTPVAKAMIECIANRATENRWFTFQQTDAEGRFTAGNCPDEGTISVTVRAKGIEDLRAADVDPRQSPLELRVQTAAPRTVRITGRVTAPDGAPVSNASVNAYRLDRADQSGMQIQATDPNGRFELGPLGPGTWTVHVRTTSYPLYRSEPRELAANDVWDLGLVQLVTGGTAIVQVEGDRDGVRLVIVDAAAKTTTALTESHDRLVSGALPPGDHRLLVMGKTAAQSLPFVVRAGEQTSLTVKLQPGVRQRFELVTALATPPSGGFTVRVHRGTELLTRTWIATKTGEVGTGEVFLPPGDYRVTVVAAAAGERELASAAFPVVTVESAALRLELH